MLRETLRKQYHGSYCQTSSFVYGVQDFQLILSLRSYVVNPSSKE